MATRQAELHSLAIKWLSLLSRDIQVQFAPPYHPSSNPVETIMCPLGKTMKIGNANAQNENESLHTMLDIYRYTPHPATGLPPATLMFQ